MNTVGKKSLTKARGIDRQKLLAPLALVIIYVFFAFVGRNFLTYTTLLNILDSSYYIGFIAIGVTYVIITGGIDLSCGTVLMCAAITGGTAFKTWGWPMWASLLLIIFVGLIFGILNGLLISRLNLPPFIATLGTQMISLGVGSIVSNVRSATFPPRGAADSWFKDLFKYMSPDNVSFPTGALVLFFVAFLAYVVLTKTKMGRYIFAIGSNKEAARLSGIDVKKWEMMAYVVSGLMAGIGGIAFAAVYTTVMPAQGSGFELYAIAGTVIGGTSMSGGSGTILGTMIGVFIMSILRVGLPSMDLQAHYQTLFTGIVVVGAVLLDIYRNKKASEIKILTPAGRYREEMKGKIALLKESLSGETGDAGRIQEEIVHLKAEMKKTYAQLVKEEKEAKLRQAEEEKEFLKTVKESS
ncbi:ABC transporter permease [Parasphaerochaeta coccoides]|uniref:Monosaccharide ABC transporter membrane protein, CUT2 family n=1 Tax=Parasphaerochaeta coccoides (strain ATCC BAA-1237 / DSM 17374 / SPN1) TaxID=760011 RepID=F4GKG0_PARC1|nr:ABC transporter permease [Parasphaerochaeta coccoides]AEC02843.1 monosaccharide ABC transporter membrane protein, CUT2 family [Parasphaerochaeta coccoides DSM 17374]